MRTRATKHIVFVSLLLMLTSGFGNHFGGINTVYAAEAPLIMGIFPRRNATATIKLFRPLAKYLSLQLGREVKLQTSKSFDSFWDGVTEQRYDIVHFNQYHYILSNQKHQYQVILKNSELGKSTIAGSIIVRKDSGIETVTDLKGKRIVFGGGEKAMQSYIVATYLLKQGGLQPGEYIEDFAKNPPNAIFSAYYKQSAAAGAGDSLLNLGVVTKRIDADKLKYLARGEQLPHLPWAVKGGMDASLKKQIQDILSGLTDTPEGQKILSHAKLSGLIKVTDQEYDRHREIVKSVFDD